MRLPAALIFLLPLAAQNPAEPAATTEPAADQAKPAEQAASPAPVNEQWLTGSIDLGWRWVNLGGNVTAYKAIVDLNSGPKLFNGDITVTDPKKRLFDRLRIRATDWGDDPYSTLHVDAEKANWYRFNAEDRDLAYFNFLPSYADPLLTRGVMLDEQSFATRKHIASFSLDLMPNNRIVPYFGYDRDTGSGTGITTFVNDANQFPLPDTDYSLTNLYRGGVRIQFRRFHATLEEGGTTFREDQDLFQNSGSINSGNVFTKVLGQTTDLTGFLAAYGIRGTSTYTKALLTVNAASWLDLYGQFLYSEPNTSVHYQQNDAGNLLLQSQVLFYTSEAYLVTSAAKMPHTTGSFGGEIRPHRRVRLLENWLTDRLHNSASAAQNDVLANPALSNQIAAALASSLVTNYNQFETDILFDATSKLMLRGGYRYVWGDASDAVLPPADLASSDAARLRRNVGLGAISFRPVQKLLLSADADIARSGSDYFRTSLYNYERVRARARYQLLRSLNLTADFSALLNNNPTTGVKYDFRAQQESLSFFWTPKAAFGLQGSYTRSTIYSDIGYLDPGSLGAETSLYRDNAHLVTGLVDFKLPGAKLTAGGSMFLSSGSRPTRYYQPILTFWFPVGQHVSWFADWRYYGYAEPFYLYEAFRGQLVSTGLRLTR